MNEEWLSGHVGDAVVSDDAAWLDALADLELGMLDGRDQATSARLSLPCPAPPSPEALAAAREGCLCGNALVNELCGCRCHREIADMRDSGEATEQEGAPALCPCGERPATGAGYCDECRADGAGAP